MEMASEMTLRDSPPLSSDFFQRLAEFVDFVGSMVVDSSLSEERWGVDKERLMRRHAPEFLSYSPEIFWGK